MLALALILDALFGEPEVLWRRVPHPAVLMGRLIDLLDRRWNRGGARQLRGAGALSVMVTASATVAWVVGLIPFAETVGAAVLLAQRSLVDHVSQVGEGLRQGLGKGRAAVALIVGRDPETLDESGVARAAIESAAENFSDGVVAPAFWFALAGLPGMAVYKAVNTADSMIGHRTPRHEAFGWASARLDDLLSWVPARATALVFAAIGGGRCAMAAAAREGPRHRSVNAGWPEAAMAATLGVRLAGPRIYGGRPTNDPWINAEGRAAGAEDIRRAVRLLWRGWALLLLVALIGTVAFN